MRLVRAVREIQPEDVGAGRDERVEHRVGVARGPDGGDDLGWRVMVVIVRRSSVGSWSWFDANHEPRTASAN